MPDPSSKLVEEKLFRIIAVHPVILPGAEPPGLRIAPRPIEFRQPSTCPTKWAVVPRRISEKSQWLLHNIEGGKPSREHDLIYRHCWQISTSWKYHREVKNVLDSRAYKVDEEFCKYFRMR
ncbi:MAG: hypothetical protein ACI9FD_003603 [Gammaproteobacteria bacterium]|jgi:hypothetical protein